MLLKLPAKYRILIILSLFIVGLWFLASNPADNRDSVPGRLATETKLYPDLLVDSSTSYLRYKTILDSLTEISRWKKIQVAGFASQKWYGLFTGLSKIYECDSCNVFTLDKKNKLPGYNYKYFISFENYTLKNDASFYIDKGRYFIRYTVRDKIHENWSSGETEIKETTVRFQSGLEEFRKNKTVLLVPVSKKTYAILNVALPVLFIPLMIILSWIIFILPCKVLYRIATGRCFVIQNIRNLRLAGWALIITTLLPPVIALFLRLLLGNRLPEEIYFPARLFLNDQKGWLIAGVIFLLLSSAFKSGYKLQQEQDLTI